MGEPPRTHRVAVGAYIFHGGKLLLLRRKHPPRIFAPPGGRLTADENPVAGLHREILEETGLRIRVTGVADVWFGSVDGIQPPLLCINFMAETDKFDVHLSAEHEAHSWVTEEQIRLGKVQTLTASDHGYRPTEILRAFQRHASWHSLPE